MPTIHRMRLNRRRRTYQELTTVINRYDWFLEFYVISTVISAIVLLCLRFYATGFVVFDKWCIPQYIYMFTTVVVYWLVKRVSLLDKTTKWWLVLSPVVIFTRALPMCTFLNYKSEELQNLEWGFILYVLGVEAMVLLCGFNLAEAIEDRSHI